MPRWPLDFVTLELIAAAAEEGSISRAAIRCHLALAAASRRISEFEGRMGMRVFERQARGVRVAARAEPILARIQGLLAAYGELAGVVEDVHQGVTDHVHLLANSSVIAEFLPGLLRSFTAQHPHVRVEVEELSSSEIVQAVLQRRGSIGALWSDVGTSGLVTMPFGDDEFVLVVPQRHALARRRSVRFEETLEFDYVLFDTNSPLYLWLAREAARLNALLKGRIRVRGLDAVCGMVDAGLGIGIVPRLAAERNAKSMAITLVSLREQWARRHFSIVYRSTDQLTPVERSFIAFAEQAAAAAKANFPRPEPGSR